ncbi:MAG: hypothetical protein IIW62_01640 [Selenomonadales bacterium]|nr:hypothetical protein [Selenomonadales bacterium]
MLLVKEYLGEVGVGATSPLFFRADDGYIYIVKTMTNPLGGKVLANEYIASLFGRMLGLPFPRSDYFYITQEWFDQHPYLTDAGIGVGIHFASRYLEDVKYVTNDSLSLIRNRNEIAGMILFDHLFHNADRAHNRKNMILSRQIPIHINSTVSIIRIYSEVVDGRRILCTIGSIVSAYMIRIGMGYSSQIGYTQMIFCHIYLQSVRSIPILSKIYYALSHANGFRMQRREKLFFVLSKHVLIWSMISIVKYVPISR